MGAYFGDIVLIVMGSYSAPCPVTFFHDAETVIGIVQP